MSWLQRLFARKRMEIDLDKELRFHFDAQVADKIRSGIPESDARRLTRLEFGGIEQIKEDCRERRGHFVARIDRAGRPLRPATTAQIARLHAHRSDHFGSRHRRHYRHLHTDSVAFLIARFLWPIPRALSCRRSGHLLLLRRWI